MGLMCGLGLLTLAVPAALAQSKGADGKIPITTSSAEARDLYLRGRALTETLRATDARAFYKQAAEKDQGFALAYVGLANTSGTTKEFVDAVTRAAELADRVSEGERHLILGLEAGMKADPAAQREHYSQLVTAFPDDERARTLLGNYYFGRQEYAKAIEQYEKANAIDASFSPVYNQLGYAYRFLEKYPESERAFKKYIELLPNDPNPYDSYAELLMKMGRFDESIKNYEKALSIDPHFVASYIGIGNDQLYMNRPADARATFAKLQAAARTTGERRTAHFWTAASYVQEGTTAAALEEIQKSYALSETEHDLATMSGDLTQMGDILREAGKLDAALQKYQDAVVTMNKAEVPEQVKAAARRNLVFEEGRLAVARGDLTTAKARASAYATEVAVQSRPFEVRQQHQLTGLIALAEHRPADAVAELRQANQQDPCVLYLLAEALRASGDATQATAFAKRAANFNGLSFNQAYVHGKAQRMGTE
jgi:tetratricopeptide (TPR) repeat protein